jgi:pimeloyl-ACP methyl ester carboxylesterase
VLSRFHSGAGGARLDVRSLHAVETAKVTCPVLVVSGSDEKVVSAVTARRIAELYPRASFHEAVGRGPLLVMEKGAKALAERCADRMEEACPALRTTL